MKNIRPVVTLFNKWLIGSAMSVFLLAGNQLKEVREVNKKHPFHLSTVEINHNAVDRNLEISCRIFTDDFETALTKQYKAKSDFGKATLKMEMDSLVKKYVQANLQLKTDGKPVSFNYVGFEVDNDAVYSYFEVENIAGFRKLDATNTILHNLYDDQINVMHVIVGGKRVSNKLTYPQKQAAFTVGN